MQSFKKSFLFFHITGFTFGTPTSATSDKSLFWGVDEFYFASCINYKNHRVKVHKLKRGITSSVYKRIERHHFPIQLEWQGEIEAQQRDGIYNFTNLKSDGIIDINLPRPYSKYKDAIEEVANIILNK